MKYLILCFVLAGFLLLPVSACPDRCPVGMHPENVCEQARVCEYCWYTGQSWHRVTHCLEHCPGGQSCFQQCHAEQSCSWKCVPDKQPDPVPDPVQVVSIRPFSESIWSAFTWDNCMFLPGHYDGALLVSNRDIFIRVDYASELDGFMARSLTRGEESCKEQGFYNQQCQATYLYGTGNVIQVQDPNTYLEVVVVKNSLETALPLHVTITGSDGSLYLDQVTYDQVYHRVFQVPGTWPSCRKESKK